MTSRVFIAIVFVVLGMMSAVAHHLKPDRSQDDRTPLIWVTDPNPQRDPQVNTFNELYPEYRLSIDPGNTGVMKIVVQCSANMGPDLIDGIWDANYQTYVDAGILLDVTEQAEAMGFGLETLHPAVRPLVTMPVFTRQGTIEERQFVYPCNVWHGFILYNRNLFDEHGVPYPPEDLTWGQYVDLAKRLTVFKDGGSIPEVFGAAGVNVETILWEMGGDVLNKDGTRCTLDSEAAIDAMVYWHELLYKHGIEPSPMQKAGVQSQGGWGGGFMSWFGEGKVGMLWGARYHLIQLRRFVTEQRQMRENWLAAHPGADEKDAPPILRLGACLAPRFADGPRYVQFGARCTGINSQSPQREDALKFLQYLASEPYSRHINDGADSKPGNIRYNDLAMLENPEWAGETEVHEMSLKSMPYGRSYPRSLFVATATVQRHFGDAKQKIVSEANLTPDDIARLMRQTAHEVNLEIARNIRRNPHLHEAYQALLQQGAEPLALDLDEVQ